ncbi:MAG: hypothetical protein QM756_43335 [Polyangiaceae bacterium]
MADVFNTHDLSEMGMAWLHTAHGPVQRGRLTIRAEDRADLIQRAGKAILKKRRAAGVRDAVLVWAPDPAAFHDRIRTSLLASRDEFESRGWVQLPPELDESAERKGLWRRLFPLRKDPKWVPAWKAPPWVPLLDGALVLDCPMQLDWNGDVPHAVLRVAWAGFSELVFAGGDLVPLVPLPDDELGDQPRRFAADWAARHLDLPPGAALTPQRREEIEQAVRTVWRVMGFSPAPALRWHDSRASLGAVLDAHPPKGPMTTPHQLLRAACKRSNLDGSRSWTPHQMLVIRLLRDNRAMPDGPSTLDAWQVAAWRWRILADPLWRGITLVTRDGLPADRLDEEGQRTLLDALERAAAVPWIAGPDTVHLCDPIAQ